MTATANMVALSELYIHDRNLFKNKNLKSFVKNNKIGEHDVVRFKNNQIGITYSWIKKNLPKFNLNLAEYSPNEHRLVEVKSTLEKYKCKRFNPILLNLDSSSVHYYLVDKERTPFFTYKGLIKMMVLFNELEDNIYDWVAELHDGDLKAHCENLQNIKEMVNLPYPPLIKNGDATTLYPNGLFDISLDDVVIDFKHVNDYKKDLNIVKWKCPLFSQIQKKCKQEIISIEKSFEEKLKELRQEKTIEALKKELDKEKSLKDQALSLTQSFIPLSKVSDSPALSSESKTPVFLKPSRIK
jgi:hypothetical protein